MEGVSNEGFKEWLQAIDELCTACERLQESNARVQEALKDKPAFIEKLVNYAKDRENK